MGKLTIAAMVLCFLGVTSIAKATPGAAPGALGGAAGGPPGAAGGAAGSDWEMPKTAIWKGQRRCQVKNTEPCNKIMEKVWTECPLDDPFNACMQNKFTTDDQFSLCKPECTSSSMTRCTLPNGKC